MPKQREPEDEARFAITSEAGLAFPFVMLALFGFARGFDTLRHW